jgi:tRNA A-37 threonylcarbamoyl transferase component Bud32
MSSIFSALWHQGLSSPDMKAVFKSLDVVFGLKGEAVTSSAICAVSRIHVGNQTFYVKRYTKAGEGFRRIFGKSKARSEWQNLNRFISWGLPAAKPAVYGEEHGFRFSRRGVVTTEEINGATDLATLANQHSPLLKNTRWVSSIMEQVATATRVIHSHQFAHNDLKWRNILISGSESAPKIHLIDCPSGTFWRQPFFEYRRIKDLACLDKVAKTILSRNQRLRFYFSYNNITHLSLSDKIMIRKILAFFKGRR